MARASLDMMQRIRTHLANSFWGIADYLAYPVGMLAVSPIALREFGMERYGVWMLAGSAVSVGAIVASGFGDANIRYVAMQRATGKHDSLVRAVRSAAGIHLLLGTAMATIGWLLAPVLAGRAVPSHLALRFDCLWSLRIASALMVVRALESVCVSTQRAFERYGSAVRVSIIGRLVSLCMAGFLPRFTDSVTSVMIATAAVSLASLWRQLTELCGMLNMPRLTPSFGRQSTQAILGFGMFTWIQAVSGLIFGQVDRIITGVALGAASVTTYALCVQLSQPLYGATAAGLHFLFPRISVQRVLDDQTALRRTVIVGVCANIAMVALGTLVLLLFGETILRAWVGTKVAWQTVSLFPIIAGSTAISALSLSGGYTMLALGKVRVLTYLNIAAGAMMLASAWWLLPRYGVQGMACARMIYGPIMLAIYLPLFRTLARGGLRREHARQEYRSFDFKQRRVNILGIGVEALDLESALARVLSVLRSKRKGYVCAIGVHGIMEALGDSNVARAFAQATMVVPDGMPMVWIGRIQGHRSMKDVTGPELMQQVFARKEFAEHTHFFYGGKEGVADELASTLKRRFPGARIVGTYTPPYRELTPAEEDDLVALLHARKPDVIWIGISTPRQELFMHRLLPRLHTCLMFGVGAAFDFHTGRIRHCPRWIKLAGFHWLHRLIQDPARLWRRNLRNSAFLWHIALQLTGLRRHRLMTPEQDAFSTYETISRTSDAALLTAWRARD